MVGSGDDVASCCCCCGGLDDSVSLFVDVAVMLWLRLVFSPRFLAKLSMVSNF